jgi:hypothetical protein
MKRFNDCVRRSVSVIFAAFILMFVFSATGRAQTVIPRVCVDAPYQTGTTTLATAAAAGDKTIQVTGSVPPFVSLVINPGGANQEAVPYVRINITGSGPYTLTTGNSFANSLTSSGLGNYSLVNSHAAGETITFAGYSGLAYWGYLNTTNAVVQLQRGISSKNFFTPGPITYTNQTTQFQPGIHDAVFTSPFGGQVSDSVTWNLQNDTAIARNNAGQGCGTITYQGRLTDSSASASGQYDLQFTAYDALTGGTARSGIVMVEDAQVTNGVFTVQLNFGSSFTNNSNAKFLEIGVRAGNSTGAFTILAPRQPLTSVPFAVNALNASSVHLPVITGDPSATDCNEASEYGQMQVSTTKLYICTPAGWKSIVLQ